MSYFQAPRVLQARFLVKMAGVSLRRRAVTSQTTAATAPTKGTVGRLAPSRAAAVAGRAPWPTALIGRWAPDR